ncbi:MAG: hypothetical protein M9894_00695 [Planctomycetes bacterium]|nr:hypothetical protein [Planctomycetota bacterium]
MANLKFLVRHCRSRQHLFPIRLVFQRWAGRDLAAYACPACGQSVLFGRRTRVVHGPVVRVA